MLLRWFITKDDAGAGLDTGERLVVRIAEPHAIEALHRPPGDVIADAEIGVSVEGGHDLAGVALHLPAQHLARDAGGFGLGVDRLHHLGIEAELVDEHPALGLLKRWDLQFQPRVNLDDHPVEAAAQEPPHARPSGSGRAQPRARARPTTARIQSGSVRESVMRESYIQSGGFRPSPAVSPRKRVPSRRSSPAWWQQGSRL